MDSAFGFLQNCLDVQIRTSAYNFHIAIPARALMLLLSPPNIVSFILLPDSQNSVSAVSIVSDAHQSG